MRGALRVKWCVMIYDIIKAKFSIGEYVRVVDFAESDRADATGAINTLRDQLPIVSDWQDLRQSYISETRTHVRSYHIPEALLIGGTL